MWEGITALLTLMVMVLRLWVDHATSLQKEKDDAIKEISDACATNDISLINAVIGRLRR